MDYNGALFLIITILSAGAYAVFSYTDRRQTRKLAWIDALSFPSDFTAILERLPHYTLLDTSDRHTLERSVLRFVHTKKFVGIGIDITDEMRVIIAFYASLLLLRKNAPRPYPNTDTILVYPDAVLYDRQHNDGGIVTDEEIEIDGQSGDGTVVITWETARAEALERCEANLILHEFAHEIDFLNGEIDGIPPMDPSRLDRWTEVLDREFDALCALVDKGTNLGKHDLFGEDAAYDEAEFFAVATERFFGVPEEFEECFPELYAQFKTFYGFDPCILFSASTPSHTVT